MSAHDLLRAAGWRMRTIGGEPHWEHSAFPDVNHTTAVAMEQALAWAQRDVVELRKQLAAPRMNDVIQIRELELERDGAVRKASDALSRAERPETEVGDLRAHIRTLLGWVNETYSLLARVEPRLELAGTDLGIRISKLLCEAVLAWRELAGPQPDQPNTEERGAGAREHVHPPAESTGAGGAQPPAPRSCEDEDLEGETLP